MAKKNAIIRKLPAVETLGSSTVICSDKTGTLTQNKMKVIEYKDIFNKKLDLILKLACMCTDCNIDKKGNVDGEATEKAILEAAILQGENKNELCLKMPRINEIPFESERKMMTTIHKDNNSFKSITKGAPEILINRCTYYYNNGNIQKLDKLIVEKILDNNKEMAQKALRVIGVAYKNIDILPQNINDIEKNLIFVGLIGMMDPPRKGVKEAIITCEKAGIKTIMITGDNIITAEAIANQIRNIEKKRIIYIWKRIRQNI